MPEEPGNRDDEQVAVGHADACGGDITEDQHEEDRMRDIHVGKRGSEATSEERPDKLKKTVRFEKNLRVHQRLPEVQLGPRMCLWSILRVVRHKIGRGPYLCRSQVMLMTTYQFLRWMRSARWMYERVVTLEKCWSGIEEEMLEISREVNLNELVEILTCLNALEGKIWKSDQKVVTDEKLIRRSWWMRKVGNLGKVTRRS